ncbi:hypothetical protein Tco_1474883 [Tanacetum coccineum]
MEIDVVLKQKSREVHMIMEWIGNDSILIVDDLQMQQKGCGLLLNILQPGMSILSLMSIWEVLGGKARDVGSIREETGQKRNFLRWLLPS